MTCTSPQSMDHPHCIFCGECLTCDPHPPHTKDDGFPDAFRRRGRRR